MTRCDSETCLRSSQLVRCLGHGCESLSESLAPGSLASTAGICNMEVLPGSRRTLFSSSEMSLFSLETCTPLKATPWSTPWHHGTNYVSDCWPPFGQHKPCHKWQNGDRPRATPNARIVYFLSSLRAQTAKTLICTKSGIARIDFESQLLQFLGFTVDCCNPSNPSLELPGFSYRAHLCAMGFDGPPLDMFALWKWVCAHFARPFPTLPPLKNGPLFVPWATMGGPHSWVGRPIGSTQQNPI